MANKGAEWQKIFGFALLFVFFVQSAFSDEKRFSQRLEWKADKNAYEYRVELKAEGSAKSTFYPTEKTFLELQLKPGKYTYRVFVYDFLGREAAVSDWTAFEILKASLPEIATNATNPVMADDEGKLRLDVDIVGINDDSVVELVAEAIPGKIVEKGKNTASSSEIGSASKVEFSDVPEGKWRIRVTNPSGLSGESDVIEIQKKPVIVEVPAPEIAGEIEPVTEEISEEEAVAAVSEPLEEIAEPEVLDDESAPEIAETEEPKKEPDTTPTAIEENILPKTPKSERKKEPKPKKEKPPKPPRPPYVCKDINVMVGWDFIASVLNTMEDPANHIFDHIEWGPEIRVSYFPIKNEKTRWGGEISYFSTEARKHEMFYKCDLESTFIQASLVYQRNFLTKKTFFALKGGFGANVIKKKVEYAQVGDYQREDSSENYILPTVQLGASIFAIPMKFFVAEVGIDYTHTIMGLKAHAGFLRPYVSLGIRF